MSLTILKDNPFVIIDSQVSIEIQNFIEKELLGFNFPWYYYDKTTHDTLNFSKFNIEYDESFQFSHVFIDEGKSNSNCKELILDKLLMESNINHEIIRAKANLKFKCDKDMLHNKPHYDQQKKHFVGIYYVNDSDGDTILFDEQENILEKISPKKGRWLFFRGDVLHSASHPYKSKNRLIINIDFKNE